MKALTTSLASRVDAFLTESFALDDVVGGNPDEEIAICQAIELVVRRRRNRRLLINRMPTDVIDLVFSYAVDLNEVHNLGTTLDELEEHRKLLFTMRCVAKSWNDFLVSGPRYWQAVNLRTPSYVLQSILERAENAPLCVYSIDKNERRSSDTIDIGMTQKYLMDSAPHIRTIRSEERRYLDLWKGFFRLRTPALESLNITAATEWSNSISDTVAEWLGNDLPIIQDVSARGWQPPANAIWLGSLQALTLIRPIRVDHNLLNVLSRCTGLVNLRMEVSSSIWTGEDELSLSNPPKISLPNLRNLDLEFDDLFDIRYLVRQLDVPRDIPASLRIVYAPNSEELVEDLAHFIFPPPPPDCTRSPKPPTTSTLEVHSTPSHSPPVTYTSGPRSIKFAAPERTDEWDLLCNILIVLQNRLNNPRLHVLVDSPTERQADIVRRLGNLNVTSMCVSNGIVGSTHLDGVAAAVASRHENLPSGPSVVDEQVWPFENLRELTFEKTDISLGILTRVVGIRQKYLRENSKEWIKKIVLRECSLRGVNFTLPKATAQLERIGVELVAEGRKYKGKE
ncbi:hypothetical protein FRB90_002275 [Tulasnella sp. 427]|nr:hypothetical protein FRB90_002275 [Tulasnella sp. 427]